MSRLFLAARLFVNTFRFPFGPAPVVLFFLPNLGVSSPKTPNPPGKRVPVPWDGAKGTHPPSQGLCQRGKMLLRTQRWRGSGTGGLGVIQ